MICPACQSENDVGAEMCFTCGRGLSGLTQGAVIAGRYEIQRPLGKGGMGMVYRAHDRVLDEDVAIKVLRAGFADQPELQQRFLSEIKLARKVSHKNVCRIHEYGVDGGLRYISMAYVDGQDLKRTLKEQGPLPPDEAFDVMIQVCEGLQAIHDEGIVHRDLKTPNIMRDARGLVRLMDFGIAKEWASATTQGLTTTGMVIGTPEYVSPEQGQGKRIDARSDVYALGIVAFEVFTGDVPFRGDSAYTTIQKHIQQPPPLEGPEASRLPRSMVPLLRKALAKDPGLRHATAREMADALRQARAVTASRTDATLGGRAATAAGSLSQAVTGPTSVPGPTAPARPPGSRPLLRPEPAVEPAASSGRVWLVLGGVLLVALVLMARHRLKQPSEPPGSPPATVAAVPGPGGTPAAESPGVADPQAWTPPEGPPQTGLGSPPEAEPAGRPPAPPDGRPGGPAVEALRRGCESGAPKACFGLAEMYRMGRDGLTQDFAAAAPLYEQACDRGVNPACTHLGFMYLTGRGVPEDKERAVSLLRRACDAHEIWACKLLREMNRR